MSNYDILKNTKIAYESILSILKNFDINEEKSDNLQKAIDTLTNLYNSTYSNMLNTSKSDLITDDCCKNCSNHLLISDNIDYSYQCEECDENFYDFEIKTNKLWYRKDYDEEYKIEYWETDWHRDAGEGYIYDLTFYDYFQAISKARELYYDNNYSSIEVLKENGEAIYCCDSSSEDFYINDEVFSKVSKEIVDEYIDNWMEHKELPTDKTKLYCSMVASGYLAIDNSSGECYVEEFDTEKQVHNWFLGKDLEKKVDYEI